MFGIILFIAGSVAFWYGSLMLGEVWPWAPWLLIGCYLMWVGKGLADADESEEGST